MATNAPPQLIPVTPQLPHSADPRTINGWMLDETAVATPAVITQELERGFNRLVNNIPDADHTDYNNVMRKMTDEVMNSDTLIAYLTVSNRWNDVVRVTVIHSIARYSAGFGGSNALHGQVLAVLGETVGPQLPMLVNFVEDPDEDLVHGLAMEEVCVTSDAIVDAYFAGPAAVELMPDTTVPLGGVDMSLSTLCPSPWHGPHISLVTLSFVLCCSSLQLTYNWTLGGIPLQCAEGSTSDKSLTIILH
jgi:hypothetical protein